MFLSSFFLFERLAAGADILSFYRLLRLRLSAFSSFFLFPCSVFFRSYPSFLPFLSLVPFRSYPCFISFLSLVLFPSSPSLLSLPSPVFLASIRLLLFPCGLSLPLCLRLAVFIQSVIDARCSLSSICPRFKTLHFVPCLFSFTFPSKRTRNQYKTKTRTPYCLSPTPDVA